MSATPTGRTRVFISYSHKDRKYLNELQEHLGGLQRRGLMDVWVDTQIEAGDLWREEIRQGLSSARVAILLVSPAFLNSKFITEEEVPQLLKEARREQVRMLPIILKPCLYEETELKDYQAVNSMGRPLSGMNETQRGQVWVEVAKKVKAALETPLSRGAGAAQASRPRDYLPILSNPLFQERPGEFSCLGQMLARPEQPLRLGLVGVVGMGGVGKTQLAVELAFRYKDHFPDGRFWMPATGALPDWQYQLAELAERTGYLPPDDAPNQPDTELRRAKHFAVYLAEHAGALLVLDNVEQPELVASALSALSGNLQPACTVLYTSRVQVAPPGVQAYSVTALDEPAALQLLLAETRPAVLEAARAGIQSAEVEATRALCKAVGFLPLGLVHLRRLLERTPTLTLARLAEGVRERGALAIARKEYADLKSLFATFLLSWGQVQDPRARQLFYLAGYFPEATPIPLWLLGLAAGLGERSEPWEPLGEACQALYEVSLLELLVDDQARLHPLVREFARQLVAELPDQGQELARQAGAQLSVDLLHLTRLEQRARREGYWNCLEQVRSAVAYTALLGANQNGRLSRLERWLDVESYLLGQEALWPEVVPGLFYQQLTNRGVEEGQPTLEGKAPVRWVRQLAQVGAVDRALLRIFRGHQSVIESLAFSPDGRLVLTGSMDKTARLWETASGRLLVMLEGHQGDVTSVAFSPDGRQVLTGSADKTARLWETASGRLLVTFEGHEQYIGSVAFSPDGRQVLTGSGDETARVWWVSTGQELVRLEGHLKWVTSVAFSPDGRQALTGSGDQTARVWSVSTGQELMRLEGHQDSVSSVAFSPDGRLILTGSGSLRFSSSDTTARLWETTSGRLLVTFEGHQDGVRSVAFSPDGRQVLTGSLDETARLWETTSGRLLAALENHWFSVENVAFSPDGRQVLTSQAKTARLWEVSAARLPTEMETHHGVVRSVAFSPDGRLVLTGSKDKTARVWVVETGQELARLDGHQDSVDSVAFSPDGRLILTGSVDKTARVWETTSGQLLTILSGHQGEVRSVAFSPDGRLVLTGSEDKTARVWETTSGQLLATLEDTSWVNSVAFSPNGQQILTGSGRVYSDGEARVWETTSGKLLTILAGGHKGEVSNVAFWPDGRLVLTGSMDRTACLWETASGRLLARLSHSDAWVRTVSFSPNGRLAIYCDVSGQVCFWELSNQRISLEGIYLAPYEIKAIHWQDHQQLLLADDGGPRHKPNIYRLKLEGL